MNKIYKKIVLASIGILAILPFLRLQAEGVEATSCKLEIVKSVDKSLALDGELITYTIKFKNIGQANCTGSGVKVQDTIPSPKLTYVSETHSGNVLPGYPYPSLPQYVPVYNASNRTLTWNAEVLTPGESGQVTWTARLSTANCQMEEITNFAEITAQELGWNWIKSNTVRTEIKSDNCAPPPKMECKLAISKSVDKTNVSKDGEIVTYKLNFKNEGEADCTGGGVKIEDTVDSHLQFIDETHTSNVEAGYNLTPLYTSATRVLVWNGKVLNPGESGEITWWAKVTKVSCSSYDIPNKARISADEIGWKWIESNTVNTKVKSNDCDTPMLSGNCKVNPSKGKIGDIFNFSATVSGGTGPYSYSWTGSEGLNKSTANFTKSYSSIGTKEAIVTITSGTASITKTCKVTIEQIDAPEFNGVCLVSPLTGKIGTVFNFSASATGGTGSYSYVWTGSDGISGSGPTITKSYNTAGVKQATATITSGTEIINRTCEVAVTDLPNLTPPIVEPFCDGLVSRVNISWTEAERGNLGYEVHIDNDSNWTNGYWRKNVPTGALNTSSESGFNPVNGASGTLTLVGNNTYYARVRYIKTAENGPEISFVGSKCDGPLVVTCSVSPSSAKINELVSWRATASGKTGFFTYLWTGTDGLSGTNSEEKKAYNLTGIKSATVEVKSGNETITRTCAIEITTTNIGCVSNCGGGGTNPPNVYLTKINRPDDIPQASAYVYLSQIPYTGEDDGLRLVIYFALMIVFSFAIALYFTYRKNGHIKNLYLKAAGDFGNKILFGSNIEDHYTANGNIKKSILDEVSGEAVEDGSKLWNSYSKKIYGGQMDNNEREALEEKLETAARDSKVLLSSSAVSKIMSMANQSEMKARAILEKAVNKSRSNVAAPDEWISINDKDI